MGPQMMVQLINSKNQTDRYYSQSASSALFNLLSALLGFLCALLKWACRAENPARDHVRCLAYARHRRREGERTKDDSGSIYMSASTKVSGRRPAGFRACSGLVYVRRPNDA